VRDRELALRLLPLVLAVAPLVVLRGHVDFARLPQQAFVQVATLLLGLLWVGQGARVRGPAHGRALDLPLLAFLGWSAASLLWATDPGTGLRTLGHWAACAVVYGVVSHAARSADAPRLVGGLLFGGAAVAAVGLGQALFGLDFVPQAAVPAATLANRNVAAGYLVAVAPLALLAWSSRPARVLAALAASVMLAFLPFTRSRAAAVSVALQLVLLALAWARPAPRALRARGVPAALLAAGLALLLSTAWVTQVDPEKTRSTSIRWSLAGSALSMAQDHPMLGVGLGGFGALYPSHGAVVRSAGGTPLRVESPHNESLQVLAETGLPGLIAGVWVVAAAATVARRLRRSPDRAVRRAALALGLSLVGFAVDAALGFPLRYPVPPLALAVLLGLLTALAANEPPAVTEARMPARLALAARPLRLAAAAGFAALLALAWSSSRARLGDDRDRYTAAFLPVAHAQEACGPGVTLDRTADGRLDLSARAAPLADILRCLVERTGLRVEYEGAPPRQRVSVALRGDSLAATLESRLEGLGVNYLLSRDPSGTAVDRLIVFGSSRAAEPSGGGGPRSSPAGAPPIAAPGMPTAPLPDDESQPLDSPPGASPGAFPAFPGPPGSEPSAAPVPGENPEPMPEAGEPQDLTPLTLQLGPPLRPRLASTL
jgi:O-antigen ligase